MMKDPSNQVAGANCEHPGGLAAESSGKRQQQQQANEQTRARQLEGGQDVSEGRFARALEAADGGKENNDIAPGNQEQQTKQNGSGAPDNTCSPGERCAEMIAGEVATKTTSGQTICATPSNQQQSNKSNGSVEADSRGQVSDEPSRSGENERDLEEERKSIVRESLASAGKTPRPAEDERAKVAEARRDELGESPDHVEQRRCATKLPGHDEAGCLQAARKVSSLASSSSCCLPSSPNESSSSSSAASSQSLGFDSSSRWLRQQQLEPQHKQRQATEMLQLMRLRQQRAAAAINSTTTSTSRSHEMPTLQQLQQQLQANSARLQQQPPSGSTCVSPQQERRMQQQQQQQRKHGQPNAEDRPGNGAAATTTTNTGPTCKTLNMELEQRQQKLVQLQTTTTITAARNTTSEPLSPPMPNSAASLEATKSPSPNIVCDIEASQPVRSSLTNYLNQQNKRCQPNSIVADPDQRVASGASSGSSGRICQQADDGPRECNPAGDGAQSSSLLTTADSRTRRPIDADMANSTDDIQTGEPASPAPTGAPVPSPRAVQHQQTQSKHPIQAELSILTNTNCLMLNPRLRDLSNGGNSIQSSAQSTPSHSILSDSTTLITEAAMNSSELIPKLIERLDRKLIVMKEEQLTLKREMELNEATGQRLFESMKQHLTVNEYEKISMHAKEIEKVTKLILSLKMRLKRVEAELKERNAKSERQQRYHEDTDRSNVNNIDGNDTSSQSDRAQDRLQTISGGCNQQEDSHQSSASYLPKQPLPTVRGVSDPTSATGLPKRNHQHHASLQTDSANQSQQELMMNRANQLALVGDPTDANGPCNGLARSAANQSRHHHHHHHQVSLTNSSCDSNSSRVCSPRTHQELANSSNHRTGCNADGAIKKIISTIAEQDGSKTASTSSDSIFNYADSAIGSTIMGHGGSVTNIEQPAISQSSLSSVSSESSAHSSSTRQSSSSHHQLHSNSPSQSHLSSSISVSSHSSLSSPPLVSPASTTCLGGASPSSVSTAIGEGGDGQAFSNNAASHLMMKTTVTGASNSPGFHPRGSNVSCSSSQPESETNGSSLNSTRLSAFFADSSLNCSVSDNNNNSSLANDLLQEPLARPRGILTADSTDPKLLQQTDLDILVAKQTKLISQLEEAHQLEECIVHRNNIIIQRILKKYFDDTCPDGEIEEFRQFTRLKSLLLKDTHDIGDKIVSVELQLNELKQNNQCNA